MHACNSIYVVDSLIYSASQDLYLLAMTMITRTNSVTSLVWCAAGSLPKVLSNPIRLNILCNNNIHMHGS